MQSVADARTIGDHPFGAWVVKASPSVYDVDVIRRDGYVDAWSVQKNYRSALMQPGDHVFLWVSGGSSDMPAGFWGHGYVADPPLSESQADEHWLDPEAASKAELFVNMDLSVWDSPLTRDECKKDPVLASIELLRIGQIGNPTFLTPEERDRLLDMVDVEAQGPVVITGHGAGFGSAAHNAQVEAAATEVVHATLKGEGWTPKDVSRVKVGWDTTATRGWEERHIEIKGVSGTHPKVLLTRNEVAVARDDPSWELWVVTRALSSDPALHKFPRSVVNEAEPFIYELRARSEDPR